MITVNNVQVCTYNQSELLCIEPRASRRAHPSWIMWVAPDGSAELWTERTKTGAVVGKSIKLKSNVSRADSEEKPIESIKMPGWWTPEQLQNCERLIRPDAFERGFRNNPSQISEVEIELNRLSTSELIAIVRGE